MLPPRQNSPFCEGFVQRVRNCSRQSVFPRLIQNTSSAHLLPILDELLGYLSKLSELLRHFAVLEGKAVVGKVRGDGGRRVRCAGDVLSHRMIARALTHVADLEIRPRAWLRLVAFVLTVNCHSDSPQDRNVSSSQNIVSSLNYLQFCLY